MCILAYGLLANALNEYLRMGESTIMECTKEFAQGVIECFREDLSRLPYFGDQRWFPDMLGSLDCMH